MVLVGMKSIHPMYSVECLTISPMAVAWKTIEAMFCDGLNFTFTGKMLIYVNLRK